MRRLGSALFGALVALAIPASAQQIPWDQFKMTQGECDPSIRYSWVVIEVPPTFDMSDPKVATQLLERAAQFSQQRCKAAGIGNLSVSVRHFGATPGWDDIIQARNYDTNQLTWFEYNNKDTRKKEVEQYEQNQRRLQAEQQARQAEQQRQQQQQRIAALERAKAVKDKFTADYKVTSYIAASDLRTNPYPYKGKVVAVLVAFRQMIGDGVALFGELVVEDVPNTLFTQSGALVYLAVRVEGLKAVKLGMGDVSLPHASFVGAYFCQTSSCADFTGSN
jgi:hypothetical protein